MLYSFCSGFRIYSNSFDFGEVSSKGHQKVLLYYFVFADLLQRTFCRFTEVDLVPLSKLSGRESGKFLMEDCDNSPFQRVAEQFQVHPLLFEKQEKGGKGLSSQYQEE